MCSSRSTCARARTGPAFTTWIVVGIFTLLGLLGLGGDAPGFARLFGIIVLLANAATLVLLAIRPSNEFFARMKQPQYPQYY